MIDASHETLRPLEGENFADAVTVSWADAERGWFGMARIGVAGGEGSALAILFRGREPVGALAQGALEVPAGSDWADMAVGPLRATVDTPLERWTMAWEGSEQGFALELEAVGAPAELSASDPVAGLGGMQGYEQLVRVRGSVRAGGETVTVDGLGQRGHSWGVADWSRLELVRTVSAWMGPERGGVVLSSLRPAGSGNHADEAVWAAIVERGEAYPVADPRLSTTYDGDGHQRRAGLELWLTDEDGYPHRAAGEVICGSSLELGALRLDTAFMHWHAEGAEGVGRYDVLRKA